MNAFDIALLPLLGTVLNPRQVTIASTCMRLTVNMDTLFSIYLNTWLIHKFHNNLAMTLFITTLPLIPCFILYWKLTKLIEKWELFLTEDESAEAMLTQDDHSPLQCLKELPPVFWFLLSVITLLITANLLYKAA